jgi:tetratricopeptide (TPR) repeat protein
MAAAIGMWLFCGCKDGDIEKNPLMLKGAKLRESGDYDGARRYFRQAVAVYPEHPETYLALAQLCDEYLDDPLEALYCYRMYLQYTPEDTPEYRSAAAIAAVLEKRAVQKISGGDELKKANADLKQQIEKLKQRGARVEKMMISQQETLIRLNNELAAEKAKKKRRR